MHIHTSYSDGLLSVEDIIDKVIKSGLGGFSITDHDSFDGIEEAFQLLRKKNIDIFFLAGCEFSTIFEDSGEIHILSYFSNYKYNGMISLVQEFKKSRINRAYQIIERLKSNGFRIEQESLLKYDNVSVGRMHIARELVNLGYFQDTDRVFEKLLKPGAPCYIPRKEVPTLEVIRLIKQNGGKAVLAHPLMLYNIKNWEKINTMIEAGLDGIEYRHPKISRDLSNKIEESFFNKLILTGGSDFHGDEGKEGIGKYGMELAKVMQYFTTFADI